MTVRTVERVVDPVGGIVDPEAPFRAIGRHPQFETVTKEAPLLIGGAGGARSQDPDDDHRDP
jgi:hypothetical protein